MSDGGLLCVSLLNENVHPGAPSALMPGPYLKLSIRDTGTGIQSDHLARIFDPYFTTKPQGSGLGLATVYSIIKKHQGHIDVESVVGEGTTFRIWLPAARRRPRSERPVRLGTGSCSGRILFMDDEEPIRRLGMALLQSLGYETRVVSDGMAAFKEWEGARNQGRPYDLVMLDLTVAGGMGGLATLELMRSIDAEVKAIVTSGYSSDPVLGDYRAHGFKGVVPKPYRISDLGRTIQDVLDGEEA
jgi:CheY-like chemotaxis protein